MLERKALGPENNSLALVSLILTVGSNHFFAASGRSWVLWSVLGSPPTAWSVFVVWTLGGKFTRFCSVERYSYQQGYCLSQMMCKWFRQS